MRILDVKLKSVLEMRTDTPSMIETLDSLSAFFGELGNTTEAKRSLRNDIETNGLALCREYHQRIGGVLSRLRTIERSVGELEGKFSGVLEAIQRTEAMAGDFLRGIDELGRERRQVEERADAIIAFLKRFQLSEDCRHALSEGPVDCPEFFEGLESLDRIYGDCTEMLERGEGAMQSSCVQILGSTSEFKEMVLKRMYGWTLARCQGFSLEQIGSPSFAFLQRSLAYLAPHELYHSSCFNTYVQSRKGEVTRHVLSAAVQVQAAQRLGMQGVSDLFSVVYQDFMQERDLLASLGSESKENLSMILSGCSKGLLEFVDGLLSQMEPSLIDYFQIFQVVSYYQSIFRDLLLEEGFSKTLLQMLQMLESNLEAVVKNNVQLIDISRYPFPIDLLPLPAFIGVVEDFAAFLKLYESSAYLSVELPIELFLGILFPSLLKQLSQSARSLEPFDRLVYEINTIEEFVRLLSPFRRSASTVDYLTGESEQRTEALLQQQTLQLMQDLGFDRILEAFDEAIAGTTPASPPIGVATVKKAIKAFSSVLFSSSLARLELLGPQRRMRIRTQVHSGVFAAYCQIYEGVQRPEFHYPDPSSLFLHTPDEVKALLELP